MTPDTYSAHPHSRSARPPATASKSKRNPLHPEDVRLSPRWLALGALGGLFGLASIRRFGWRAALPFGLTGALLGIYTTLIEARSPVLERLELFFADLPPELDGLRIGQIADSHLGVPFAADNLRWAAAQMRREQPDLLLFTGDFVHRPQGLQELPELLRGLSAPLGSYTVLGNHDYWEGLNDLKATLDDLGVAVLINEHRRITWRGGEFWLVGTDDAWDGTPDLDAALEHVPMDAFTVLLAHTPHGVREAAKLGVNLQLSGHTHGGHMVLPLVGPIARPRYTDRFLRGLFHVGPTTLYVSRGIGGMPLRLLSRPEATMITLRRKV